MAGSHLDTATVMITKPAISKIDTWQQVLWAEMGNFTPRLGLLLVVLRLLPGPGGSP